MVDWSSVVDTRPGEARLHLRTRGCAASFTAGVFMRAAHPPSPLSPIKYFVKCFAESHCHPRYPGPEPLC
ncbi:unnamed protein product [Diplocarpon coronariae]